MSLLMILDFSKMPILLVWVGLFLLLNILGFVKKKSLFNLITLLLSVVFLIIHIVFKYSFDDLVAQNIITDFIFIIISIASYIYIDEIESRREVISEVFENRYKNRRKK